MRRGSSITLGLTISLFFGTIVGTALAVEPSSDCVITLTPNDADESWKAAVRAVEARVHVLAKSEGDCRELVVRIEGDGGGATVELTTTSGKKAVRRATKPSELAATVEALLVTVPDDEPTTGGAASPKVPATSGEPQPQPIIVEAPSRRLTVIVGLEGGARVGWPGRFVAPVLGGFAAVSLDRWELGIFGQWETSYSSSEMPLPPGIQLSAVVAGVTFGRRLPLSTGVALLVQGHLGGAVYEEEGAEALKQHGGVEGESRIGAAIGLSLPHQAPVRFRPMIGAELSPLRAYSHGPHVDPTFPAPPTWALTFMLALESEALL